MGARLRVSSLILTAGCVASLALAQDSRSSSRPPSDRYFNSQRSLVVKVVDDPWVKADLNYWADTFETPARGKGRRIPAGTDWFVRPGHDFHSLHSSIGENPGFSAADLADLVEEMREKDAPGLSLMTCTSIRDEDLGILAKLPDLHHLDLGPTYLPYSSTQPSLLTGKAVARLPALPKLEVLGLRELGDCRDWGGHPQLRDTALTDDDLAPLRSMVSLREIDLSCCAKLTATGLKNLAALKNLRRLNLSSTMLGDEAIVELNRSAGSVEDLRLSRTPITDRSMPILASMPRLTRLDLELCHNLTGTGILQLAESKSLAEIDFGLVAENLFGKRKVAFHRTYPGITKADFEALARAMPRCKIFY